MRRRLAGWLLATTWNSEGLVVTVVLTRVSWVLAWCREVLEADVLRLLFVLWSSFLLATCALPCPRALVG